MFSSLVFWLFVLCGKDLEIDSFGDCCWGTTLEIQHQPSTVGISVLSRDSQQRMVSARTMTVTVNETPHTLNHDLRSLNPLTSSSGRHSADST